MNPALEAARNAANESRTNLATARATLASASNALASLKPDDFDTQASHAKALKSARAAVQSAEDAVSFYEPRASAASAAVVPLEIEALRAEASGGIMARGVALEALRQAIEGLPLDGVRESLTLLREAQGGIDVALRDLRARGEDPAQETSELSTRILATVPQDVTAIAAALSAALACVTEMGAQTLRDSERAEAQRAAQLDRQRRWNDECRMGRHGPEEEARALAEMNADLKRFYGGPGAIARAAKGTVVATSIEVDEANS